MKQYSLWSRSVSQLREGASGWCVLSVVVWIPEARNGCYYCVHVFVANY